MGANRHRLPCSCRVREWHRHCSQPSRQWTPTQPITHPQQEGGSGNAFAGAALPLPLICYSSHRFRSERSRHLAQRPGTNHLGSAAQPLCWLPRRLMPAVFSYFEGVARVPHGHGASLRSDEFSTSQQLRPSVTVYIIPNMQHGAQQTETSIFPTSRSHISKRTTTNIRAVSANENEQILIHSVRSGDHAHSTSRRQATRGPPTIVRTITAITAITIITHSSRVHPVAHMTAHKALHHRFARGTAQGGDGHMASR